MSSNYDPTASYKRPYERPPPYFPSSGPVSRTSQMLEYPTTRSAGTSIIYRPAALRPLVPDYQPRAENRSEIRVVWNTFNYERTVSDENWKISQKWNEGGWKGLEGPAQVVETFFYWRKCWKSRYVQFKASHAKTTSITCELPSGFNSFVPSNRRHRQTFEEFTNQIEESERTHYFVSGRAREEDPFRESVQDLQRWKYYFSVRMEVWHFVLCELHDFLWGKDGVETVKEWTSADPDPDTKRSLKITRANYTSPNEFAIILEANDPIVPYEISPEHPHSRHGVFIVFCLPPTKPATVPTYPLVQGFRGARR